MYLKRRVTFYQLHLGKCTQEGREWKNIGHAQDAAHGQIWLEDKVKGKVAKVHGKPQVHKVYIWGCLRTQI